MQLPFLQTVEISSRCCQLHFQVLGENLSSRLYYTLVLWFTLKFKLKTYKPVHKNMLKIMINDWVMVPSQFLTDEFDISLN